jgi:Lrp/AsnC family leucine-responsive transcriptional regulator
VRELVRSGVIRGYRAEIDSAQLGLKVEAFVQVTLSSVQHAEFEASVLQHPAVLQCFTTAGQGDYLVHVLVAGIAELDSLLRMEISQMPGVQKIETTVCMKTIKRRAPITGCLR